jgi:hypothetical protein
MDMLFRETSETQAVHTGVQEAVPLGSEAWVGPALRPNADADLP